MCIYIYMYIYMYMCVYIYICAYGTRIDRVFCQRMNVS